jgi:hypothetical protein
MTTQQHTRRESLGGLVDPRWASKAAVRSTHTPTDIARIEQAYGVVYEGSCYDGDNQTLIPVFYRAKDRPALADD